MCGIVGIAGIEPVNTRIYDTLTVLQHRGQDAAGIATTEGGQVFLRKDNGMVKDVFKTRDMQELSGHLGIGHVRYPTAGTSSTYEAQPLYVNSPYGIVLSHNGNLTNAATLKDELFALDRRHLNTRSDSEVLLNVLAHELSKQLIDTLKPEHLFAALESVHRRCEGAYATVAMIPGFGLIAFRDEHGIRPLCYGFRETDKGREFMVASESVAIEASGFTFEADVLPGGAVIFDVRDRSLHTHQAASAKQHTPCLFEYVYLARPDSIIDGVSVYKSRLRMGDYLAAKILRERPDHQIDVVIPVPDTSRTAAIQVAYHIGAKFREGFIKNRYIGRTFIMPGQAVRKKSVRQKLNPIALEFRGKNVLLVDDSIVRGTTCSEIIRMAREAGAKTVSFASASPAVRYPNVYGIDMPAAQELIAHSRTTEQIQQIIGADWLIYQDLEDLRTAAQEGNPEITSYEDCVFSGRYVTGGVSEAYLDDLEAVRNDQSKSS
jgi:amidophosphoribosyltransferase